MVAGYIHGDIVHNVTSYDFTSSYPYVLVTHKYPATKFKLCRIKSEEQLLPNMAYLMVVKFTNVKRAKNSPFNLFIR